MFIYLIHIREYKKDTKPNSITFSGDSLDHIIIPLQSWYQKKGETCPFTSNQLFSIEHDLSYPFIAGLCKNKWTILDQPELQIELEKIPLIRNYSYQTIRNAFYNNVLLHRSLESETHMTKGLIDWIILYRYSLESKIQQELDNVYQNIQENPIQSIIQDIISGTYPILYEFLSLHNAFFVKA
jgi:hypothetical protein